MAWRMGHKCPIRQLSRLHNRDTSRVLSVISYRIIGTGINLACILHGVLILCGSLLPVLNGVLAIDF